MAMAGFDMACWDALAQARLAYRSQVCSAVAARRIPAYNSCGLGLMAPDKLADEAEKLAWNFRAVKLRLGYPTLREDLAALHAVRTRLGDGISIMVDYNQALSVADAMERGRALDRENIVWLEEPIRHDDYAGAASLARELKMPVQIGENFSLPAAMEAALAAKASDLVMPDLERIGGVTGWLRAAELAAAQPHADVIASLSGVQRASAGGDADRALARIRRLGRQDRLPSRLRSPTAMPSCRSGRAAGSRGTRRRSSGIGCNSPPDPYSAVVVMDSGFTRFARAPE